MTADKRGKANPVPSLRRFHRWELNGIAALEGHARLLFATSNLSSDGAEYFFAAWYTICCAKEGTGIDAGRIFAFAADHVVHLICLLLPGNSLPLIAQFSCSAWATCTGALNK